MNKTYKRIAIGTLAALTIFFGIGYAGILALKRTMCQSNHLETFPSPFGEVKAEVFNFDCGATSGFTTNIALVSNQEKTPLDNTDAFFVADDNGGKFGRDVYDGGGPKVAVKWITKDKITVSYPAEARAFKADNQSAGVTIEYIKE